MPESTAKPSTDPYKKDGGKEYHEAIHGGLGEYGYSLVARRRAAKIQPHIASTDKVLEYGVGPGWNLAKLKAASRKGFDISSTVKRMVEAQGIEFTEQISSTDRHAYDVVICSHVLEHLEDPRTALDAIAGYLGPGGKALLFVPFDYSKKFRKYDPAEPNHHIYSWCVQSFGNLLALHGFSIVEWKFRKFGYERIIAKWVERFHLPSWTYSILLSMALFVRPEYEIFFVVRRDV